MIEFRQALKHLAHAIAADPARANLNAIHFESRDGLILGVSSDGFRLSVVRVDVPDAPAHEAILQNGGRSVAVTPALAIELSKQPIELTLDWLNAHALAGVFPDYAQVVPRPVEATDSLTVDRKALLNAITKLTREIEAARKAFCAPLDVQLAALREKRAAVIKEMTARKNSLATLRKAHKAAIAAVAAPTPKEQRESVASLRLVHTAEQSEHQRAVNALDDQRNALKTSIDKLLSTRNAAEGDIGVKLLWDAYSDQLLLSWQHLVIGSAMAVVACTVNRASDDPTIGVNVSFLRDALSVIKNESITIHMTGAQAPIRIDHSTGYEVIMPMRL